MTGSDGVLVHLSRPEVDRVLNALRRYEAYHAVQGREAAAGEARDLAEKLEQARADQREGQHG